MAVSRAQCLTLKIRSMISGTFQNLGFFGAKEQYATRIRALRDTESETRLPASILCEFVALPACQHAAALTN